VCECRFLASLMRHLPFCCCVLSSFPWHIQTRKGLRKISVPRLWQCGCALPWRNDARRSFFAPSADDKTGASHSSSGACIASTYRMTSGHQDVILQLIREYQALNASEIEYRNSSPTPLEFSRIVRSNRPVVFKSSHYFL
jgi:hypothetical protein